MLNVDQPSGSVFSRMARHSRRSGSASVHFFCCRRLRPIWASRPASSGLSLGYVILSLAQLLLDQIPELGVLPRLQIGVDQLADCAAKRGEAFRRLMGFFEERDRLLEPAGILVVDPEVGHRYLRIWVLAAELGLSALEHVLE